jgi:hypothetical protein
MKYIYIDGDDIGLKIENSFMNNDEASLKEINNSVKMVIQKITLYLKEMNYEIIFSGADGIICKNDNVDVSNLLNFIRDLDYKLEFSIGVGMSLRDAYIALRYSKSNGKNIGTIFDKKFKLIKL